MSKSLNCDDGYFESILQIRPKDNNLIEFVENQIRKNNIYVAKREELKGGINFKLSSNKFVLQLARKLKKSFKGNLKISKTLYSRDRLTSKNIYRVTVCFRLKQQDL